MNTKKTPHLSSTDYLRIAWNCGWAPILTALIAAAWFWSLQSGSFFDPCEWDSLKPALQCGTTVVITDVQADQSANVSAVQTVNGKVINTILAATTALLIMCNTLAYLIGFNSVENDSDQKWLKRAKGITALCAGITGLWLVRLMWAKPKWEWLNHADEVIPLVVFLLFIVVDTITYRIFHARFDLHALPKDRIEKEFTLSQIFFVDLPVVAGIALALLVGLRLDHSFANMKNFLDAFFAGAVLMHLAASQFIFIFIAARKEIALAKDQCAVKLPGNSVHAAAMPMNKK